MELVRTEQISEWLEHPVTEALYLHLKLKSEGLDLQSVFHRGDAQKTHDGQAEIHFRKIELLDLLNMFNTPEMIEEDLHDAQRYQSERDSASRIPRPDPG